MMQHSTTLNNNASSLDISVVVCTYNRADSLLKTLRCLASQTITDDFSWEVIIVDNNSTDHTRETVFRFASEQPCPVIRYEFEGRQGLSYARNHGIDCARGDIIVFTDDDVCPEPEWLTELATSMRRFECDACGGYIAPIWEETPPHWLTERFYGFLAVRTDSSGPRTIVEKGDVPFGANMAFKRDIFQRFGQFDTGRGRKGKVLASGEDGELFQRLLQSGSKVYYFPNARVHHRVEAWRLRKSYFRRWRFQTSSNLAQHIGIAGDKRLLGIPLYIFPQLFRACWRAMVAKLRSPADEAFYQEIIVWHFFGTLNGLYRTRSVRAQR